MTDAARLPRRDAAMASILLGAMLLIDVAAVIITPAMLEPRRVVALAVMPGTLALIWGCYALSLGRIARHPNAGRATAKASAFMGRSLSLVGSVLTVAHIGMVGGMADWFDVDKALFLRGFMVALSVALILMHNKMPKFLASAASANGPPVMVRGQRFIAVVGILCGLGMIVVALTLPIGRMTVPFLGLALLPTVLTLGNSLIFWLDRRRNPNP